MPASRAFSAKFGQRAGEQKSDPAADRRADDNLRPLGQRAKNREGLFRPPANGSVGEGAFRFAMAGIIEAQTGAALPFSERIEEFRLGAAHVGAEAAKPEQAGGIFPLAGEKSEARRGGVWSEKSGWQGHLAIGSGRG